MKLVISFFLMPTVTMYLWFLLMVFLFFIGRSQNVKIEEDSFEDNAIFLKIKGLIRPKFYTHGQKRYKIIKEKKKSENLNLYFKQMDDIGLNNKMKDLNSQNIARAKMASKTVLQKNVNIPIHTTDISTFDDSYSFMKEKFQAEMRKISIEMDKFSSDLSRLYGSPTINSSSSSPQNASVTSPQDASVTSKNTSLTSQKKTLAAQKKGAGKKKKGAEEAGVLSPEPTVVESMQTGATLESMGGSAQDKALAADQANWAAITESPLILEEGEGKKLKLQFDVSQFDPAEVKVQIINDVLQVKAKHDERTDNILVLREYNRLFMLPRGIDPEAVVSSLSRDGVLTVEAPLPQLVLELGKELEKMKTDKQ